MSLRTWIVAAGLSASAVSQVSAKPFELPANPRVNAVVEMIVETTPVVETPSPNEALAGEAFADGERHRQLGRVAEARRRYQETHLLAPTSRVGQQAMQRIRELESTGNGFSEEQEPPLNRTSGYRPPVEPRRDAGRDASRVKPSREEYEDMLRRTEPLGPATESY